MPKDEKWKYVIFEAPKKCPICHSILSRVLAGVLWVALCSQCGFLTLAELFANEEQLDEIKKAGFKVIRKVEAVKSGANERGRDMVQ